MQSMEQPQSDGSRESGLTVPSEEAILTLMEFMALSRPIAIEFLMQHNGNIEAAIAHIIG